MSTILDALKKSEQERKLNNVPTLSDMPAPAEQTPWLAIALGIVALLLVIIIVWFVTNQQWLTYDREVQLGTDQIVINNETLLGTQANTVLAEDVADTEQVVVNVISYSDDPLVRFVIINGKLFRENEFVKAGIKVESILSDSVILVDRGERVSMQP